MPQPHSTASATILPPVPVAVLLPPPASRDGTSTAGDLSTWYGVAPRDAAGLVARYSQPGELVVDLDGHPTITQAARHLGRRPTAPPRDSDPSLPTPASVQPPDGTEKAGLILAGLGPCDLSTATAVLQTWRTWLRAGGYLLTALTPPGSDSTEDGPVSHRATVIAAARAGFTWQQEFLVLTAPPPEDEPRALPDTPTAIAAALIEGRHRPVHIRVLAFRHEGGDRDA
jgi:hypothetical protein